MYQLLTIIALHFKDIPKVLENNGSIQNNGIFRVDSNQMRTVGGKQRIYLECPRAVYNTHAPVITLLN